MNITKLGPFTILISGIEIAGLTRSEWRKAIGVMADRIQGEIAKSFNKERVAGSSQLRTNSPEYTARKVRQGYSPKRGHRTNTLQSVLDPKASTLYTISGPYKNGNARIIFKESLLHALVPYAEYYEEKKVRRAGILEITRTWALKHRGPVDVAQRLAKKALEAAEAIAVRRGAVFAGPRPIRARRINARDFGSISRQARAGLTPAQLRKIERLIG